MLLAVGSGHAVAQEIDLERLTSELQPAIHTMLTDGNVPSATIALVVGDRTVWTNGYGYANVWAKTAAVPETVYLIGSTFKPCRRWRCCAIWRALSSSSTTR